MGGLCPPIGSPLAFASRPFGTPGRQRRKVCIFAPQKWGGFLFLAIILLRKNTPRGVHAAAADFNQGEGSP